MIGEKLFEGPLCKLRPETTRGAGVCVSTDARDFMAGELGAGRGLRLARGARQRLAPREKDGGGRGEAAIDERDRQVELGARRRGEEVGAELS